jgi:hypothetical protein
MNEEWRSRITMEPGKRGGRPCIPEVYLSIRREEKATMGSAPSA